MIVLIFLRSRAVEYKSRWILSDCVRQGVHAHHVRLRPGGLEIAGCMFGWPCGGIGCGQSENIP